MRALIIFVLFAGLGLALGACAPSFRALSQLELAVAPQATFMGTMAHDNLGVFFKGYLIFAGVVIALAALRSSEMVNVPQGEVFALILAVGSLALWRQRRVAPVHQR